MTITRANAETELVDRAGNRMELVGMAVTVIGSNADLNGPLGYALRKLGLSASATVSDSDLSALTDDQLNEFYDRAEWRLLNNILGNSNLANYTTGPRKEELSNLAVELEKAISRMEKFIQRVYGDSAPLTFGNIAVQFQATDGDTDYDG